MAYVESLVQECVDFISPSLRSLKETEKILYEPTDVNAFPQEVLQFQWKPLLDRSPSLNVDSLVALVLKRVVTDSLLNEMENEIENDTKTDAKKSQIDNSGIKICAVALDFCFHSRKYRDEPSLWCVSYFSLFTTVTEILSWPCGIQHFWPYAESRIEWFKMCNDLNPLPIGMTNLISYKQPLYDKLRHWNDILKIIENNSYLNTPLHYTMKFKLEKFLSELLPIHEESNFNRSALISNRQSSGNPWNKTISSATRTDPSSESIFATDYNYIFDNLLTAPLEFVYKPLEFKLELDRLLTPLLDAIFEIEEDFYKQTRNSHKKISEINQKLNYNYPVNFEVIQIRSPNYMKISDKIQEGRAKYWEEFIKFDQSTSIMVQPTLYDISILNPETLYQQMMELDNDFYRKQFLLQLYFTVGLIRHILTSADVENYYKICYQREKPSRSIKFDDLNDSNRKRTLVICNHILDNRINKFYRFKDPQFASIIQKLYNADEYFLRAKIDGFKSFQSFKIPDLPVNEAPFEYSFKKFGFIKMGNKSISNVWKTNTGVALIKKRPASPKELHSELYQKWKGRKEKIDTIQNVSDDKIVKQWQILRSLRSEYLFDFSKVNELTGIDGLFDSSLMENRLGESKRSLNGILAKMKQPHRAKLEQARRFMEDRENKKRLREEEREQETAKKAKLTEDKSSSESISTGVSNEMTERNVEESTQNSVTEPLERVQQAKEGEVLSESPQKSVTTPLEQVQQPKEGEVQSENLLQGQVEDHKINEPISAMIDTEEKLDGNTPLPIGLEQEPEGATIISEKDFTSDENKQTDLNKTPNKD